MVNILSNGMKIEQDIRYIAERPFWYKVDKHLIVKDQSLSLCSKEKECGYFKYPMQMEIEDEKVSYTIVVHTKEDENKNKIFVVSYSVAGMDPVYIYVNDSNDVNAFSFVKIKEVDNKGVVFVTKRLKVFFDFKNEKIYIKIFSAKMMEISSTPSTEENGEKAKRKIKLVKSSAGWFARCKY